MKTLPIGIKQATAVTRSKLGGITGLDSSFCREIKSVKDSLKDVFTSSKEPISCLLKSSEPSFEKFLTLIDTFKQKKIDFKYFLPVILCKDPDFNNGIDFERVESLLNLRESSLKNSFRLNQFDRIVSKKDIDKMLFSAPNKTYNMLNLIGENAFIYSYKEKLDNVKDYINILGEAQMKDSLTESLLKITNPKESIDYKNLTRKISVLKNLYKTSNNEIDKEALQKAIATVTKSRQELLNRALKDPKDILEAALVINSLKTSNVRDLKRLVTLYSQKDDESCFELKSFLNKKLFNNMGFNIPSSKTLEKLDFTNSKYLSKLFYAPSRFNVEFAKLIRLLEKQSSKTTIEVLNNLPQNKLTQKVFQRYGFDYDLWTNPTSVPPLKLFGLGNRDLTIRKVDMENFEHSLFLGEMSNCCTKINGKFGECSVTYIKNKMIQAIEILDGEQSIGNTMCYMAMLDEKPCLILDNIELKPQYHGSAIIKEGVFNFAKNLAKKICGKDIPVYLCPKRNDISVDDMKLKLGDLMLVGDTGEDSVYVNFANQKFQINNETRFFGKMSLFVVQE